MFKCASVFGYKHILYDKKQTTIGYLIGNNRIKDYLRKDGSVPPEFSASELETRRMNSACCRCLVHILSRARSATCLHIIITLGWRRCTRKSRYMGRFLLLENEGDESVRDEIVKHSRKKFARKREEISERKSSSGSLSRKAIKTNKAPEEKITD